MKKIKSRKGETIGEVLIALLISALALMMLAGAITSSSNLIGKSKTREQAYYAKNSALANHDGTGISTSQNVNLQITDNTSGISDDDKLHLNSMKITYYENDEFSKTPVIGYAYEVPAPSLIP